MDEEELGGEELDTEARAALLRSLLEMTQDAPEDEDELFFTNASAVSEELRGRRTSARHARRVAEYVADPENRVAGTADEYFNLAGWFRGKSDYLSALMVARRGLELHPTDVDLLSAAISSATGCGRYEECEELIGRAEELGRSFWGDRLYVAILVYLRDRMGGESDTSERALACVKAYEEAFPFDEVAYNQHAEILLALGRVDEATAVLEHAISGSLGPDGNFQAKIVAPQCCLTYIDEVLSGKAGRAAYEKIIQVARKGIEYSAQERERANMGYYLYREAEAQDALICSAESEKDGFGNEARVREALKTYRCAYEMLPARYDEYLRIIRKRYLLLTNRSGITDLPLVDKD